MRYLLLVVCILFSVQSLAQSQCDDATLRGSYGFILSYSSGSRLIGVFDYSGDGKVAIHGRKVVSGQLQAMNLSGTYSVHEGCVGEITIPGSQGKDLSFLFVIVGDGSEIQTIVTNQMNAPSFVQKRQ